MTAYQIRARESTLEPPTRDEDYLAFLRTRVCAVCYHRGTEWNPMQAAHTGMRGRATSQKADDRDAIPLCQRCHLTSLRNYHSFDRESDWVAAHRIDLPALRAKYLARYRKANPLPGDRVAECGK